MEINISKVLTEYSQISEQMKFLEARKKELASTIKTYAEEKGTKNDKGSYYAETDNFIFGNEARKSIKLNQEKALEYLKEHDLVEKYTETQIIVNEELLASAVECEEIPMEDFEQLCDVKVTSAVSVKQKENSAPSSEAVPTVTETKIKLPQRKR